MCGQKVPWFANRVHNHVYRFGQLAIYTKIIFFNLLCKSFDQKTISLENFMQK